MCASEGMKRRPGQIAHSLRDPGGPVGPVLEQLLPFGALRSPSGPFGEYGAPPRAPPAPRGLRVPRMTDCLQMGHEVVHPARVRDAFVWGASCPGRDKQTKMEQSRTTRRGKMRKFVEFVGNFCISKPISATLPGLALLKVLLRRRASGT